MTYSTSTRFAGLAAAMLASLVMVSVANARPVNLNPNGTDQTGVNTQSTNSVPDRADGIGVIVSGTVGAPDRADKLGVVVSGPVGAPDRADKLGVVTASPFAVPDRADLLGTVNGPGPVSVATVSSSSSDSFDGNNVPFAAAAIFALALLAAIGSLIVRKRTDPAALAS